MPDEKKALKKVEVKDLEAKKIQAKGGMFNINQLASQAFNNYSQMQGS